MRRNAGLRPAGAAASRAAAADRRPEAAGPAGWKPALLFLLAFALRWMVASQLGAMPLSRTPQYDSLEYLGWAQHIAAGDFTWPSPPPHGPGYPFFLGLILALTGGSLTAARVVQSFGGALTCLFIARAARRWFGERAGLAAGAVLALYAPLIWIDVSILAEGLLLTLTAAAIWCVATERHPAFIGALIGLAALVRPTALIFLPLFAFAGAKNWRKRALVVAVAAAVIAPVTIANARATHRFIPIQAFGGMNTYLGNSPFRDGMPSARPGGDWDRIEPEAIRHGAADEDHYFIAKTRNEIASHPLAWFALLGKKLVRTLQNDEIRDTHSFYFFARQIWLLRVLPNFTILFALAVVGLISRRNAFLATYILLAIVSCVALVVASRYRLPLVLGLAPFAGVAIDRFITSSWRQRTALLAIALLAGAATRAWPHAPSRNVAEEWALTAQSLVKEQKVDDAEQAARRALELDAKSALAWDQLGTILVKREMRDGAVAAFARAVSINDEFERAHVHRGRLLLEAHDARGAVAELRRAASIDPSDPVAAEALANTLLQSGDVAAAAAAYERVIKLDPRNASALLQLARVEGALGKPAEGLAHAQRAVELQDATGDDWILITILAVHAKRFDVAEDALQRAQMSLGITPQVVFATAALRYEQGRLDEAQQLLDEIEQRMPGIPDVRAMRAAIEAARKK